MTLEKVTSSAALATAKGGPRQIQPKDREEPINTWAIFGFVDGTDTGAKGEKTPFQESVIRPSRQHSSFGQVSGNVGIAYSITDSTIAWLSALNAYEQNASLSVANNTSVPTNAIGFGGSAGLKYNILERGSSPIGVAVQVEPYWERASENTVGLHTTQTVGSRSDSC